MNERDQIISFLLQACDQKNSMIADLHKQLSSRPQKDSEAVDHGDGAQRRVNGETK